MSPVVTLLRNTVWREEGKQALMGTYPNPHVGFILSTFPIATEPAVKGLSKANPVFRVHCTGKMSRGTCLGGS
jgi:hypothetical protein